MTMTGTGPIPAILGQLAAQAEQLTRLDAREAGHHAAVAGRLAELTDLIADTGHAPGDDAAAPGRPEALDRQAAGLAAQPSPDGGGPARYHPDPAPAWRKLAAAERQQPVAGLRAWVEQAYRPGYGHLAAAPGPCWASRDLGLYGLDILSGLWPVLYLQPRRSAGLLSAQAGYQARILPALAAQLQAETSSCGHTRRRVPGPGQPASPS
jgi:hypothetical protein